MFRPRGQRHEYSCQPFRWLESRPGCALGAGPRDGVDREPGRDRNGRGRYPGEGHDVPVEVGLVGVAAFCRYQGGAVTRGEAAGRVVETDQLGGALGGEADLGPEPGPQALAAPSDLGCQPLDPDPSPAGHHLPPGEGDFGVGRPACLVPPGERGLRDREPVVP
jgi:hypothetical protein